MRTLTSVSSPAYLFFTLGLVSATALSGTSVPVVRDDAEIRIVGTVGATASLFGGADSTPATESNVSATPATANAALISELREATGFTWDQLSKLFGVSRRTVHLWAAGGNLTAHNRESLGAIVREVRELRTKAPEDLHLRFLAILDRERASFASTEQDVNRPASTYAGQA